MTEQSASVFHQQIKDKQPLRDKIAQGIDHNTKLTIVPFGYSREIENELKRPKKGTLGRKEHREFFNKSHHSKIISSGKKRG